MLPGHVACLHLKGGVGGVGYSMDGNPRSLSTVQLQRAHVGARASRGLLTGHDARALLVALHEHESEPLVASLDAAKLAAVRAAVGAWFGGAVEATGVEATGDRDAGLLLAAAAW